MDTDSLYKAVGKLTESQTVEELHKETHRPMIECRNRLRDFEYNKKARKYFLTTGKSPYYYVIVEIGPLGTEFDKFIVTDENIAKDYCTHTEHTRYFKRQIELEGE